MRNPGIVARCAALLGIDPRSGKNNSRFFHGPLLARGGREHARSCLPASIWLPISVTVVGLLSSPVLIACDPARRRREQPAGIWSHRSRGLLELNGPARYQISV